MQSFNARAVNGPEYFCRGAGNSTVRSMIARGQKAEDNIWYTFYDN